MRNIEHEFVTIKIETKLSKFTLILGILSIGSFSIIICICGDKIVSKIISCRD